MNPTNYIEIDSTYRDRKKFPSPGEFEVQFARAAQTDPLAMADAVSIQANIVPGETQAPWNLYTLNEFADIAGFVQTGTGPANLGGQKYRTSVHHTTEQTEGNGRRNGASF